MLLYQVNITPQQILQIPSCCCVIIELGRHDGEKVNITSLMMLVSGNRAKNTQRSNAKAFLQLVGMTSDDIYIFAL